MRVNEKSRIKTAEKFANRVKNDLADFGLSALDFKLSLYEQINFIFRRGRFD